MRRPDLPQVWVLDAEVAAPEWAERVAPGSDAHVARLETARLIVANNLLPPFRKSAGTTYLQTWHGTPLKPVGFDLPDPDPGYLEHLAAEAQAWDLLLSPSPAATPRLRSAFRYAGPVLEGGYPRNDLLAGAGPTGRLETVLYAPTFREPETFDLRLDVAAIAEALDVDVLVRLHHFAPDGTIPAHTRVHDVTDHPDLRELLLRADALITDHSSVMADFALLDRPIVLFESEIVVDAPGPLVDTTDGVVAALRNDRWQEPRAAFRRTYGALEDGRASDRVISAIL